MLCVFVRASATTCRISEIVSTNRILEAVLGIRIGAASDVVCPRADRRANIPRHLGVALRNLGSKVSFKPSTSGRTST